MSAAAPSRAITLFGTEEPRPEVRVLEAGRLAVELENGKLRYVRIDGKEAIRAIGFVVRGPGWETFQPAIAGLDIRETASGFTVRYDGVVDAFCGRLRLRAEIEGEARGRLHFDVACEALGDFNTNRTGFVVLHPIEGVAGAPCHVEKVDGTIEETRFPDLIMPLQPFFDMRAISHEVSPGVTVTCRMEGEDPWECEDQRNWSDASYKTYYRPLRLPFPYVIPKGRTVRQSVTLTVEGAARGGARQAGGAIAVRLGGPAPGAVPRLGLGVPDHQIEASIDAAALIRTVKPHVLVCGIDPAQGESEAQLAGYQRLSAATGVPVQLEIVVPCVRPVADEIGAVAAAARRVGLVPESIVVEQARLLRFTLQTVEALGIPSFEETYAAARAAFPSTTLGGGVFSNFTELNRNHARPALFDYLTHSTCAVVHEPDDRSIMETLETMPAIIRSAKALAGGKPYRIAPSAIGMRQNPYGPSTHDNRDNGRHSFNQQDPRQRALFGAAFMLGYVARMAAGGVDVVSLGAPVGEFGLGHRRMAHAQPWFDDLPEAAVFPLYHVFAALSADAGAACLAAESESPGQVLALSYRRREARLVWLANLTAETQDVAITNMPSRRAHIGRLDESNFVDACTAPGAFAAAEGAIGDPSRLRLPPYGIVRLAFDD